ncbi:MAG: adenylate/guanylate cyclase domain-containing protein [Phreatobacter sp.]|nr:adenylate/guanylate cyclase domain-containing protein [Phreatobacter sp.]
MRQPLKRKITAILAADIAEYTRITAEDEDETLSRLGAYRQVFDDLVARGGGRVFNSAGDSVMCEFPSAVEATRCAIDIQESFRTRNLSYPAHRQMHFRIGISIGDVVERDGDLLGDVVNIAARLQALAEPGSICISRSVQEAVANKTSVPSLDMGNREVKNLPYPVHVFKIDVKRPAAEPAGRSRTTGQASTAPRPVALWVLAGIVVAASGAGLLWTKLSKSPVVDEAPTPGIASPGPGESGTVTETPGLAQVPSDRPSSSGTDGLKPSPATLAERYQSARRLEGRGDIEAARRDYAAILRLGTEVIDPALRLASLMRAQEGRAAALDASAELAGGHGRMVALIHALHVDGANRLRRLEEIAAADPDFAPVHYLIAAELSGPRSGARTLAEKRLERAALERFLAASREGALERFVIDPATRAAWLERARERQGLLEGLFAEGRDRLSMAFTPTSSGWVGTIALPEPAVTIEYRFGESGSFRSTGLMQIIEPRTGRPMPKPSIEFPHRRDAMDIALRYTDAAGVASPVTTIGFEPATALQRGMKDTLKGIASSWAVFGTGQNSDRLYLTALISYRCAIDKVEIGFDGQAPGTVFPLLTCDPGQPFGVPAGARNFLGVAPSVASVAVRLTFVGGEVSEVVTFARPPRR